MTFMWVGRLEAINSIITVDEEVVAEPPFIIISTADGVVS